MRGKAWALVALAGLLGSAVLVNSVTAQEKGDEAVRLRVMEHARGSYLGVYISDVSTDDVGRLELPGERGVLITGVADEGPAREAGLEVDDVILSWNGDRVESAAQLRRLLSETPAGRQVELGVFRNGAPRTIDVELGEGGGLAHALRWSGDFGWDEEHATELRRQLEQVREHVKDLNVKIRPRVLSFMSMRGGRLGVGIQSLGEQLGEYFGLGDRSGVLITTVKEGSPAAEAGLRAGDVILAVDGENVEDPGDLTRLVWGAEAGPVEIRILRDRSERTVTAELPESEGEWTFEEGPETSSFFFGPGEVDVGDVRLDWVEPLEIHVPQFRFRSRPEGFWKPRGVEPVSVSPSQRALSI